MCCSVASYSNRLSRICRSCNVPGSEVGNPQFQCQPIHQDRIQQLVAMNNYVELKKLCQYNVENAFFKVDFGGCPYGVFGAAMPIELLHSLENGLMKDCLEILFYEVQYAQQ